MQASQSEGLLDPGTADISPTERLPVRPGEVKLFVHKPGWSQEVGWAMSMWHDWTGRDETDFVYLRVTLWDFHLSHAAALYLLQGASLKMLFSDVVLKIGNRDPEIYSLALSEAPRLTVPPPRIRRVVLANVFERAAHLTPEQIYERIFLAESTYAEKMKQGLPIGQQ